MTKETLKKLLEIVIENGFNRLGNITNYSFDYNISKDLECDDSLLHSDYIVSWHYIQDYNWDISFQKKYFKPKKEKIPNITDIAKVNTARLNTATINKADLIY